MARRDSPPFLYLARIIMGGRVYWGDVVLKPEEESTSKISSTPFGSDDPSQVFTFDEVVCSPGQRPSGVRVSAVVGKTTCTQKLVRLPCHRNLTNDPMTDTRDQHRHLAPVRGRMEVVLYPKYKLEEAMERLDEACRTTSRDFSPS